MEMVFEDAKGAYCSPCGERVPLRAFRDGEQQFVDLGPHEAHLAE